jgi:hypothetical protein
MKSGKINAKYALVIPFSLSPSFHYSIIPIGAKPLSSYIDGSSQNFSRATYSDIQTNSASGLIFKHVKLGHRLSQIFGFL